MKIIYCIDSLVSSGGTERVVTTKLNWFATQSEHDVHVITLQEDEPPYFALDSRIKRLIIRVAPGDTKLYKTELAKILCKISWMILTHRSKSGRIRWRIRSTAIPLSSRRWKS